MKELYTHIILLLVGVVLGLFVGFFLPQLAGTRADSDALLDAIVSEWTSPDSSHSYLTAGIPARKELPDARPKFFPSKVRELAEWLEQKYKIPAQVTMAQYALESKWGASNLNASNYFGHTFNAVKTFMSNPKYVWAREQVVKNGVKVLGDSIRFANYSSIEECFRVHGRYLSRLQRFNNAFTSASSPEEFAREIAKAGYATDPQYALKLITIMKLYL